MSMRVSAPSRWETQTRTGVPNPAAPLYSNRPRAITAVPDEVELRLDGNPRKAHCGALFHVPEDRELGWTGNGVDVSFETRAIAVRHVFHQFGDVEALQAPLDRLSNLEEGLTRVYGEEDPIELGLRHPCGVYCLVCCFHLMYLSLEFRFCFRIAFRLVQADQSISLLRPRADH
jgi:hypothetical protein